MSDQFPNILEDNLSIHDVMFEPRPIIEEISLIIPTLGRDILEQCLYYILLGTVWPGCLIIVNQGPYEKVARWLEHLQSLGITLKHIHSSQHGRSAGLNRGFEKVETQFFAITDDDCFVDPAWLERMAIKLRQNPGAIVTGRVEAAGKDLLVMVTSKIPAEYNRPRLKFDSLSGGNMGSSMVVLNKVGFFDEDPCMRTAEDAEWAYRALRKHIPIIYDPDVCLWHFGWRDLENRAQQYRHYAKSHGGFYGKYLRRGDCFIALRVLVHHARALRRCISGLMTGNREMTLYGWSYLTGLLPGIISGFWRRGVA